MDSNLIKSKHFITLIPFILECKDKGMKAESIIQELSKKDLFLNKSTYENYLFRYYKKTNYNKGSNNESNNIKLDNRNEISNDHEKQDEILESSKYEFGTPEYREAIHRETMKIVEKHQKSRITGLGFNRKK